MKRRGFTLIELMVVIAIIIILAAIAIPNYLSMTARAKRSRVASDFAAIATAVETYRTDWNEYPLAATALKIAGTDLDTAAAGPACELAGGAGVAKNSGTTAAGETAPIVYMTSNILKSMINPYSTASEDQYTYISGPNAATAVNQHWLLVAPTVAGATTKLLYRTDELTTLTDDAEGTLAILPID